MKNTPAALKVGHSYTLFKYVASETAVRYAEASGDRNPLHLEASAAAGRGLSGPVLHGMCSLSIMLSGLISFLGEGAFVRRVDCRFSAPVIPGEVIAFKYQLERSENGEYEFLVFARNSAGREVLKNARVSASVGLYRRE